MSKGRGQKSAFVRVPWHRLLLFKGSKKTQVVEGLGEDASSGQGDALGVSLEKKETESLACLHPN